MPPPAATTPIRPLSAPVRDFGTSSKDRFVPTKDLRLAAEVLRAASVIRASNRPPRAKAPRVTTATSNQPILLSARSGGYRSPRWGSTGLAVKPPPARAADMIMLISCLSCTPDKRGAGTQPWQFHRPCPPGQEEFPSWHAGTPAELVGTIESRAISSGMSQWACHTPPGTPQVSMPADRLTAVSADLTSRLVPGFLADIGTTPERRSELADRRTTTANTNAV